MVKQTIGPATLYCTDSLAGNVDFDSADVLIADPPYDIWADVSLNFNNETVVAFTNYQNRHSCEHAIARKLRTEVVWHYPDGRWVSESLPRQTHAAILIYGRTATAAAGDLQYKKTQRKGDSAIGTWKQQGRVYVPKDRGHLASVITMPRNMSNDAGGFGKPVALIEMLLRYIGANSVADPFMGSGTTGVAALKNGYRFVGVERDKKLFEIACERIKAAYQQPSLFEESPQAATQGALL